MIYILEFECPDESIAVIAKISLKNVPGIDINSIILKEGDEL